MNSHEIVSATVIRLQFTFRGNSDTLTPDTCEKQNKILPDLNQPRLIWRAAI